jgi:hypothetical protein
MLTQLRNNRIYHLLEEQEQQKDVQNNQQQLHQFSSQPTASETHQH